MLLRRNILCRSTRNKMAIRNPTYLKVSFFLCLSSLIRQVLSHPGEEIFIFINKWTGTESTEDKKQPNTTLGCIKKSRLECEKYTLKGLSLYLTLFCADLSPGRPIQHKLTNLMLFHLSCLRSIYEYTP